MNPAIIARHKELMTQFGMEPDALRPIEFFFFAPTEDAASNLMISLHELGYKLYELGRPREDFDRWDVVGHTPMMSTEVSVMADWYEAMTDLAAIHNCEFDGYGTLVTEPEEGWDSIL